jgi:hypothetical protein
VVPVIAEDRERDLEVRLQWPSSHVGTLLPARQTELPGRQVRAPRMRNPARTNRPVPARRDRQALPAATTTPTVMELAERVQELTTVVAGLAARMNAQVAEVKRAGGAFNELRQSTDELRVLRDAIESLVTSRNERQASLEAQLELLTNEIRALRRQVPAGKRGAQEQTLADTIGDAVRSALKPNGGANGSPSPKRRRR